MFGDLITASSSTSDGDDKLDVVDPHIEDHLVISLEKWWFCLCLYHHSIVNKRIGQP